MSSKYYSSHKALLYQPVAKFKTKEKCWVCKKLFMRLSGTSKKYCSDKCKLKYKKLI